MIFFSLVETRSRIEINILIMGQTECFETSAHKIQKPGNHPKERIQHSEHGESLKSSIYSLSVDVWVLSWLILIDRTCTFLCVNFYFEQTMTIDPARS